MNGRFRDYVTDTAFRLAIGKTHITAMVAIKEGNQERGTAMGLWVTAIHSLVRRGLVDAIPIYETEDGFYRPEAKFIAANANQPFSKRYKLSAEGEAVWTLLVLAGLVEDVKPKRSRKVA